MQTSVLTDEVWTILSHFGVNTKLLTDVFNCDQISSGNLSSKGNQAFLKQPVAELKVIADLYK